LQALENIAKLKKENSCMLAALNSTVHLVWGLNFWTA
jgi:hypothetical protein